jgi:hypothetical protein
MAGKGDRGGAYSVLVRRSEGKSQLGKPRLRWADNIEIDIPEMRWGMEWIYLT